MERVFLKTLGENPHDHLTREVYADWLEEYGPELASPKAGYLRTTVNWAKLAEDDQNRAALSQQLQSLAAILPADWLASVSCLPIENCHARQKTPTEQLRELPFHFVCDRRWEDLTLTESDAVRFCAACREQVHFCATIEDAQEHVTSGHCVALSPVLSRAPGDLLGMQLKMFRVPANLEPGARPEPPEILRDEGRRTHAASD